jgi:LPPG:FO 2-phospho-L-lactate transferase
MADGPVRTEVRTDDGWLEFQSTSSISARARSRGPVLPDLGPTPQVVAAIDAAEVVVIGPSNPIVSIGRSSPGRSGRWSRAAVPAFRSGGPPDRGGVALKAGRSDARVAGHDRAPRSGPDVPRCGQRVHLRQPDTAAEPEIAALGLRTLVTDTIMADADGRARLARAVLDFAGRP